MDLLYILLIWISLCAVASLLVWVLTAAAKALFFPRLGYERVLTLGVSLGSLVFAILYIMAVLNS